jgi:hypothetical protein
MTDRSARDYDAAPPLAPATLEALRAVGYDLRTALADIVDNSLAAGAKRIDIELFWDRENSWIRISDDGRGMTDAGLREAMTLGTVSPLDDRDPADLGRFGLGLKTASFSQCRRLTVRSRSKGALPATRCWDFDFVRTINDWALLKAAVDGVGDRLVGETLDAHHGTVVLWQLLDRVIAEPHDTHAKDSFQERMEEVFAHLGMVFHRYLTGRGKATIRVNGNEVTAWDPFLEEHEATQQLPEEVMGTGGDLVRIRPYILPHQSKLPGREYDQAGSDAGWTAREGFYIYRNRRMLTAGGWLGMFAQEEAYKLARIMVDIPNTLDMVWRIDVRKAQAHPPPPARRQLKRIAKATRERARRVYGYRGAVAARRASQELIPVWQQVNVRGGVSYRLNREHPMLSHLLDQPVAETTRAVSAFVQTVEETIPVNLILTQFNDHQASQDAPFAGREKDLKLVIESMAEILAESGQSPAEVARQLLEMEPFRHYPELVAAVVPAGVDP